MASIRREIAVASAPAACWGAIADVGALHTRLVPGFVTDCRLEDDGAARVVTFANGVVARELIVDSDPEARRLAWTAVGGRLSHHNASVQVLEAADGGSRIVWIADLLPHAMAPAIATMIDAGMAAMKKALDAQPAGKP